MGYGIERIASRGREGDIRACKRKDCRINAPFMVPTRHSWYLVMKKRMGSCGGAVFLLGDVAGKQPGVPYYRLIGRDSLGRLRTPTVSRSS